MDIHIMAAGHPHQEKLREYYTAKLEKKYGIYPFAKKIEVTVKNSDDKYQVALEMVPENGKNLFAKDTDKSEKKAFKEAIRKMNSQVEKYKKKHYHSTHRP